VFEAELEAEVPYEDERDLAEAEMVPAEDGRGPAELDLGYQKSKRGLLMAPTQLNVAGSSWKSDEERESGDEAEEKVRPRKRTRSDGGIPLWQRGADLAHGLRPASRPLARGLRSANEDGAPSSSLPHAQLQPWTGKKWGRRATPTRRKHRPVTRRRTIGSSIQKFICFHTCHAV
jgi:hypothetical protein